MRKPRNLREVSDRGQLQAIPESLAEREAKIAWEQATTDCPRKDGEDMEAWSARIKYRAEELRAKGQWWEEK